MKISRSGFAAIGVAVAVCAGTALAQQPIETGAPHARCLNACAMQTTSPNGNAGVDGMVSVVAHELEEATTDPDLNAWYDANGAENADKCAWTFGSNLSVTNGAYYNMTLATATGSTRNFLIQRNLDVNSKCYVNYATKGQ